MCYYSYGPAFMCNSVFHSYHCQYTFFACYNQCVNYTTRMECSFLLLFVSYINAFCTDMNISFPGLGQLGFIETFYVLSMEFFSLYYIHNSYSQSFHGIPQIFSVHAFLLIYFYFMCTDVLSVLYKSTTYVQCPQRLKEGD